MSKLEDILQQEVNQEISALIAEADAKAAALIAEAKTRAEGIVAAKQRALEAERAAALKRAESAAELMVATARMQAKGQAIDRVKAGLAESLAKLPQGANWATLLTKLADEALSAVAEPEAVVVGPADAKHLETWAKAKGLELRTDPSVSLGVKVVAKGGKTQVGNTLPERLERAWDGLSAKVAQSLGI